MDPSQDSLIIPVRTLAQLDRMLDARVLEAGE